MANARVGSPSGEDPIASPDDRVQPHDGQILASVALAAVYIGDEKIDGIPTRDDFLAWVIASNGYWTRLAQYGIDFGTLVGSARIPSSSFFTAELSAGFVTWDQLAADVAYFATYAGGYENALIFFLPTSVGLTNTPGGAQVSCTAIGGYHQTVNVGGYTLPYAVILPCANFPLDMLASHELVEMVTNRWEMPDGTTRTPPRRSATSATSPSRSPSTCGAPAASGRTPTTPASRRDSRGYLKVGGRTAHTKATSSIVKGVLEALGAHNARERPRAPLGAGAGTEVQMTAD